MATLTIRNVPDEVHRALRIRAARNGRSVEAEVRQILAEGVRSQGGLRIGSELRRYGMRIGGIDLAGQ